MEKTCKKLSSRVDSVTYKDNRLGKKYDKVLGVTSQGVMVKVTSVF